MALTVEQQAAAYRFLRQCSPFSSAHMAISVNCPQYINGRLIDGDRCLWGDELDAYIMQMVQAREGTVVREPPRGEVWGRKLQNGQ